MTDKRILVNTEEGLESLLQQLRDAEVISFDTETRALFSSADLVKPCQPICGFCFATREGEGFYIPVRHAEGKQLDFDYVVERIKPILQDPAKKVGGHNIKYDLMCCMNEGFDFVPSWDSMIETHLNGDGLVGFGEGGKKEKLGLKDLVEYYFKYKMKRLVPDFFKQQKDVNFSLINIKDATLYAAADPDYTLRLHLREIKRLKCNFLYDVEMKLVPIVIDMEQTGVELDIPFMRAEAKRLYATADDLQQQILDYFSDRLGYTVNINLGSTKQLADMLFDKLKIPVQARSEKTGAPSTSDAALAGIRDDYPVIHNLLTWRELIKQARDFYTKYADMCDENNRIHTDYGQVGGASSGRFNSSNPNIQNISHDKHWIILIITKYKGFDDAVAFKQFLFKYFGLEYKPGINLKSFLPSDAKEPLHLGTWDDKEWVVTLNGELAYDITSYPRKAFIAGKGKKLHEADYSQVESKILAVKAGEYSLLVAFDRLEDIHKIVASGLLGKSIESITKDDRQIGKALNHAIPYGLTEYGLAHRLQCSVNMALEHLNNYFASRPAVKAYIDRTRDKAKQSKRVATHFGRIQKVPEFFGDMTYKKLMRGERAAVNRIIQGTSADITKIGMYRTFMILKKRFGDAAKMIMTTHDSIIVQADDSISENDIIKALCDGLVFPIKDFPRLTIDIKKGDVWGDAKPIWENSQWLELYELYPEKAYLFAEYHDKVVTPTARRQDPRPEDTVINGEGRDTDMVYILELKDGITSNQAQKLTHLLQNNKGTNVFVIKSGDFEKRLEKYPSCLTAEDRTLFKAIVACDVRVHKESLKIDSLLA